MQVLYPRCSGLDIHKATIAACVLGALDAAPVFWCASPANPTEQLEQPAHNPQRKKPAGAAYLGKPLVWSLREPGANGAGERLPRLSPRA
jgi:hypothetical protein